MIARVHPQMERHCLPRFAEGDKFLLSLSLNRYLLGFRGYLSGRWLLSHWPVWARGSESCTEFLELELILVALMLWLPELQKTRLVLHCDNLGAFQAWKNLGSPHQGVHYASDGRCLC